MGWALGVGWGGGWRRTIDYATMFPVFPEKEREREREMYIFADILCRFISRLVLCH